MPAEGGAARWGWPRTPGQAAQLRHRQDRRAGLGYLGGILVALSGHAGVASPRAARSTSVRIVWQLDSCVSLRRRSGGVSQAPGQNGNAPALPPVLVARRFLTPRCRDTFRRGEQTRCPARWCQAYLRADQPVCAWKGPCRYRPGRGRGGRQAGDLGSKAVPRTCETRRSSASSGGHVRRWQGIMQGSFRNRITHR